jgi:inhibitor of KinA sporulation pathway (predicted exonuclease)
MVDDDDEIEDPVISLQQNIVNLFNTQEEINLNQIKEKFGAQFSVQTIHDAIYSLYKQEKIFSPKENCYRISVA